MDLQLPVILHFWVPSLRFRPQYSSLRNARIKLHHGHLIKDAGPVWPRLHKVGKTRRKAHSNWATFWAPKVCSNGHIKMGCIVTITSRAGLL